jgi:predicted Zn-dependent protease
MENPSLTVEEAYAKSFDGTADRLPAGPESLQGRHGLLDLAHQAVEAARTSGADYADARFVTEETESLSVKNQEMEGIDRSLSQGVGIRVLVGGYWGFAATARSTPEDLDRTARLAVGIARAAARLPMAR